MGKVNWWEVASAAADGFTGKSGVGSAIRVTGSLINKKKKRRWNEVDNSADTDDYGNVTVPAKSTFDDEEDVEDYW